VRFLFLTAAICLILSSQISADDYWQQEVNYRMEVTLGGDLRRISGEIYIEYINNSPDTLPVLYLKAFPHAIQKGSYADLKRRKQNDYGYASLAPESEGSLVVSPLPLKGRPALATYESPSEQAISVDNSIITLTLSRPLLPGDTSRLALAFTTVLPRPAQMRMGVSGGVTKAAYWYPQVCVYDHKLGWVNAQYLGWGECYGDFGRFDVRIAAPEDQIVAATGVCVNEQEMLPDSLRGQLDIGNFLKPSSEWPRLEFDRQRAKTWHYIAENVNDFVFTASSQFCIDSDSVGEVEVVAYPLRRNARRWQEAVRLGREAITTFSELFLPYQWPVIRICDAYSGMEYPMLTNCRHGGSEKGFALLLYHEIGHQWFMGQIGFNQVDRAFLDEGFTTHAEHNAMEKHLGRIGNIGEPDNWYERLFGPQIEDRYIRGFYPLLMMMKHGYDKPMVFVYDRGEEYYPYRVSAYYKSAAMHYSLRSVLGDSAYYAAMQDFCRTWLFKHPYEDDLVRSLESSTGLELTEFFDQWYYGRDRLDYAFDRMKSSRDGDSYQHTIRLRRPGEFVSPIDVAVVFPQGDTSFYTVPPEGMDYAKPGHILLPTWHQFRRLDDTYEFTLKARRDVSRVIIDPDQLLMDINRLNNQTRLFGVVPPIEVRFDNLLYDRTPLDKYALRWRPDLWYDEVNGVQAGLHLHGSFLEIENRFSLDARVGTESARPFIDGRLATPIGILGYNSIVYNRYLRADRRWAFVNGYEKRFKKHYSRPDQEILRIEMGLQDVSGDQTSRLVPIEEDISQYFAPQVWDANYTAYFNLITGWIRTFRYGEYQFVTTQLIGESEDQGTHRGFMQSEYDFAVALGRGARRYLELQLGAVSTNGDPPSHFLHQLSRMPAYRRFLDAPVFRSPGTIPPDWEDDIYLAGSGVRGYQDRPVYLTESWSASLMVTPPDLLPYRWLRPLPLVGSFLSRVDQSFFVDAAAITMDGRESLYPFPISANETLPHGDQWAYYVSAGVSLRFPSVWHGHRFRLDFPIYLNKPAAGDDEVEFRFSMAWLLPGVFEGP